MYYYNILTVYWWSKLVMDYKAITLNHTSLCNIMTWPDKKLICKINLLQTCHCNTHYSTILFCIHFNPYPAE